MNRRLVPAALACWLSFTILTATADDMENIVVTASRTPALLNDVGSAVSLITRDEIARRNATTLADLLRDIPGMAVSQQGGTGTLAQIRVRGAEANQVLVLIDGVEANDIAQGSDFNFAHVVATDIERIEIVRGPQSALWGSDALAGVINVITDAGPGVTDGYNLLAEAGSFDSRKVAASLDRSGELADLSLGLSRFSTDGTNISRTGDERDGYENTTARLASHVHVSDRQELTILLRNTDTTTDFDTIDFFATGLPVDAPFTTDSTQRYGLVSLAIDFSDRIEQRISLSRTDTENTNHTDSPVDDVTRGTKDSLHLQTNFLFGEEIVSVVAEHEEDSFEQRGAVTFFGDPNKDLGARTSSIAAEFRHSGDSLSLSASARHDRNSEFEDANTWRVTALWHVNPSTGLFASTGRGVKNPTFTDRFGFFDTFIGNPDLRPERSLGWEIGLRQAVPVAQLQISASYYQSKLQDEIDGFVFDPSSGAFTARNLIDDSQRQGAEIEFTWKATPQLSVRGNYAWLEATAPSATGDAEEIRRPGDSATIRANYALPNANVNLGVTYSGRQLDDFFPPFPPFQERVELPAYTLVNLSVQYRLTPTIAVTGRIENLLDKDYEDVFGFREPGLGAFVGVRVTTAR